jgi:cytochrome c-type biogenesis protein CcmH
MAAMLLWVIFAAMTGAAAMAVLWPLSRRAALAEGPATEVGFYEAQLAEIEADRQRGFIGEAEAKSARTEAARRLLRASERAGLSDDGQDERALRRRRAASALAISMIPLISLGLYGAFGSPNLPSMPLAQRLQQDPAAMELSQAVARVEAHLARNPGDGRGWDVLAPIYVSLGRLNEAANAYAQAGRILGETPARLADQGEALTLAAQGVVSAEAQALFTRAVELERLHPKASYYLALALEQEGNKTAAAAKLRELLAASPPDAPWLGAVRNRIARIEGTPPPALQSGPASAAGQAVAALPPGEQRAAIEGMVASLAERLRQQGGSPEEWTRLVRARHVLDGPQAATEALAQARSALSSQPDALTGLDRLAGELGIGGNKP